MNHKVRVIKRGDREELKHERRQQPSPHPTREITTNIKLWVSEFQERRRSNKDRPRTARELLNNAESVG